MSGATLKERAGAASTATGPNVAIAASLTTSDNAIEQFSPDENLPCDEVEIDGAELLDRILEFFTRFLDLPDHAAVSMALWAGHTHLMVGDTTPRLAFVSAESACGKTLALRLAALLCPRSLGPTIGTSASLIKTLDAKKGRPTFFLDVLHTKLGPRAKGDDRLQALIEMGHQMDCSDLTSELRDNQWCAVQKNVFAAMAIAGTGDFLLPTIRTCSIVVNMLKRLPDKKIEPYRRRDHRHVGLALGAKLASWADQIRNDATACRPLLPDSIVDRVADVWEPLIIVGDLAGGKWPNLARQAAIASVRSAKANDKPSFGLRLLFDIRTSFGDEKDRLPSGELVGKLLAIEDAPWRDLGYRKMLDQYVLAEMLREFGIGPHSIRMPNGKTPKGYYRTDFEDAWNRYLPQQENGATGATCATDKENLDKIETSNASDDLSSPPPSQRGGHGGGVANLKAENLAI